jgi:hypothetical protein
MCAEVRGRLDSDGKALTMACMTLDQPTRIVIARPPRKRPSKLVAAAVTGTRIVYALSWKQPDA